MTAGPIVTDPFLRSVLDAASSARQQCLELLDFVEADAQPLTESPPREFQLELSHLQKRLYAYVAQLRGLNRDAVLGVRQTKQATAEARQEIDRLHLQLQNLYYKQRHLRGEIAACEGYDHLYEKLPLIPADEFLEQHPDHMGDDENALMVGRINHEYTERLALEETRQGLLEKKEGLIVESNKRKDSLTALDKELERFIDAAKPVQKIFEEKEH